MRVSGGVKGSGYGCSGGKASVGEFTDLRWVTAEDRASTIRSDLASRRASRGEDQTASDGMKRTLADCFWPGASTMQPVSMSLSPLRLKASVMLLTSSAQKNGSPGGV